MKVQFVCFVFLAVHIPSVYSQDEEKVNAAICRLTAERIPPYERFELYQSIFAAAGPDGLDKLLLIGDGSIAVQSAWKSVHLMMPSDVGDSSNRTETERLNWFLGFLQGRARVAPPKWWSNALRGGDVKPDPYHDSTIDSIRCPTDASIEKTGASYLYRVGDKQVTVPEKVLLREDNGELSGHISGCFSSDRCFLAVHNDSIYVHVACVDLTSGKLIWHSTDCEWSWGSVSWDSSWVSVVPAPDDRIFVFGAAGNGFYAFGFDASCGRSLLRFSSEY